MSAVVEQNAPAAAAQPARKDPPVPEWFLENTRHFEDVKAHPEKYTFYTNTRQMFADILAGSDEDDSDA